MRHPSSMPRSMLYPLVVLAFALSAAQGQDWPEFRGPTSQGHSVEQDLPVEWSETRNIVWKTPVPGRGWSSPVVARGRVWLTTATDEALRLVAFDVETGREVLNAEVFRRRAGASINPKNSRASPTPVVDGDRVFVHFGADGTAALTTSGELVWQRRFSYESQHGAGGSPIVYDDLLILSCDGSDQAFVVALDKETGKVRWRTNRRYPADQAYTTPLVIRVGERDEIVSVGAYRAAAYDPRNREGNLARRLPGRILERAPPRLRARSRLRRDGLPAARRSWRCAPTGQATSRKRTWRGLSVEARRSHRRPYSWVTSCIIVNDGGIASCLDARTGELHWQQRLGGSFSASPVFADGRIYFLAEQGVTTVVAPGKTFKPLATNPLDGAALASMGVAGRSFFIRTETHLYRIARSKLTGARLIRTAAPNPVAPAPDGARVQPCGPDARRRPARTRACRLRETTPPTLLPPHRCRRREPATDVRS